MVASLESDMDLPLLGDVEAEEVLAIDIALERLARLDARASRVVECRIFGGLTLEETARVLDLSTNRPESAGGDGVSGLHRERDRDWQGSA